MSLFHSLDHHLCRNPSLSHTGWIWCLEKLLTVFSGYFPPSEFFPGHKLRTLLAIFSDMFTVNNLNDENKVHA